MLYEIFDINHFSLLVPSNTITADRPIEAARKYLEKIGEQSKKLKVSASNNVRLKVSPCVIQDGRLFLLVGKPHRQIWFEVTDMPKQDPIF